MNDLPKVTKYIEVFLVADDTNIIALSQSSENIEKNLVMIISNLLIPNELVVDMRKLSK